MENECYLRLRPIISKFPCLHQIIDDDFLSEQCESELKNYLLKRLDDKKSNHVTHQHLPTLERRLAELAPVTGYDRLKYLLKGASDWDEYQEFLAQIDIALFFKHNNLLKEIEPEFPHRLGNADILISFSQQDIYCEITSFQSLLKSIQSKTKSEKNKIQDRVRELRKEQPWETEQDIEHELKIKRAVRNLLDKTKRQLPPNHPGILALETGKSMMFGFDVRKIAQKLFPGRRQVALIMLWSWESDGGDDSDLRWEMNNPSFCFINGGAKFLRVGETLLKYLGLKGETIGV